MLLNKVCMSRLGANRHLGCLWSWETPRGGGWMGRSSRGQNTNWPHRIDGTGIFPYHVLQMYVKINHKWLLWVKCFRVSTSMRFDDNHAIICSKKWSFNKFDCFDNWKQQSEQPRQTINKQSPNYYNITNHTIPTSTFQRVLFEP